MPSAPCARPRISSPPKPILGLKPWWTDLSGPDQRVVKIRTTRGDDRGLISPVTRSSAGSSACSRRSRFIFARGLAASGGQVLRLEDLARVEQVVRVQGALDRAHDLH